MVKSLYLSDRFFGLSILIILLFFAGFFTGIFFLLGKIALLLFLVLLIFDFYLLFRSGNKVLVTRELPHRLSNGDENEINIYLKNNYPFRVNVMGIDELPFQLQIRDFKMETRLMSGEEKKLQYKIIPKSRGEYEFGKVNIFISTDIYLIKRRFTYVNESNTLACYPSFLMMKKYELLAISDRLSEAGITKTRKIGHHTEFDQIREYVFGDDYRSLNWKASARKARLMVNQYQDERAQQVYCVLDKGRIMKMPFDGMTLLDYAINSSLVISNIVAQKHDKAGLITFNTKMDTFIPAGNRNNQMYKILEALYIQDTGFLESNYELLYATVRQRISHRSLLILFTNFESLSSLHRQIHILKKLSDLHLLLIVFFENSEMKAITEKSAGSVEDIYVRTIAEKFIFEKRIIVKELNKAGIFSILTRPHDLTVNLINKYLEFKHQGRI